MSGLMLCTATFGTGVRFQVVPPSVVATMVGFTITPSEFTPPPLAIQPCSASEKSIAVAPRPTIPASAGAVCEGPTIPWAGRSGPADPLFRGGPEPPSATASNTATASRATTPRTPHVRQSLCRRTRRASSMSASGDEVRPAGPSGRRPGSTSKTMVLAYIALWTPSTRVMSCRSTNRSPRRSAGHWPRARPSQVSACLRPATWPPFWASTRTRSCGRCRDLRDEGLVEFRRGRGITVTKTAPARSAVILSAKDLLHLARHQGLRRDELVAIIEGLP